ncbi:MAG: carbohydrate ABC transporter permease [Sporolactobacillus sp.]|nr:carbohydrate ABC transporter permease [Sporolactobacillus sp.]
MKESTTDRTFGVVVYLVLALVTVIVLYPLIDILSASISNPAAVARGKVWLMPIDINFKAYLSIFHNNEIIIGYKNTLFYTTVGTLINIVMTVMIAYPLSRKDFYGRNVITFFIVFTMFFSGGMIPTYLVVKELGMLNTFWAVTVPGAVSVYNVIVMRTFFQNIPDDLRESAELDGCSSWQYLIHILLPLSKPIIAVMVLFYAVGHWNNFFDALIYLTDRNKYPLQLFLREMLIQGNMSDMNTISDSSISNFMLQVEGLKYAAVVVANLPMLILYPFLQKYFVKGVLVGSLKG